VLAFMFAAIPARVHAIFYVIRPLFVSGSVNRAGPWANEASASPFHRRSHLDFSVAKIMEVSPVSQSEFVRDKFAKQIKKFDSLVETWSRLVHLGAGKANQSVDDALTESGHIVAC
jgi:hypothetical protein